MWAWSSTSDIDQITLASFAAKDNGLQIIGIAQGTFPRKTHRCSSWPSRKSRQQGERIICISHVWRLSMTFLDNWTMLFGDSSAVKAALNARDGQPAA